MHDAHHLPRLEPTTVALVSYTLAAVIFARPSPSYRGMLLFPVAQHATCKNLQDLARNHRGDQKREVL